jgi:hypothetical protein
MQLRGEPSSPPPCCEARARRLVEELIEHEDARLEADGQRVLAGIGEKYPRLWRGALGYTSVHVLELRPPAAAMRLSLSCPVCSEEVTTIIVASQVLLTIQRLMLLFGETMRVVRDERLSHVTFLEPTDEQVDEFRAILVAYVAGKGLGHPEGHRISERWAALDKPVGLYLRTSAELGQLWFLGHEVGHGFTSERFHQDYGYADNREALEAELKQISDVGPRTLRLWAEELNADVFATHLLYESLLDGPRRERRMDYESVMDIISDDRQGGDWPGPEARLRVSQVLAGGVAAACEALFQLELAVCGPRMEIEEEFTPSHPPVHLRWNILSRYLRHLGESGDEPSDMFLANMIGQASQRFVMKARPRHVRGLPDVQ